MFGLLEFAESYSSNRTARIAKNSIGIYLEWVYGIERTHRHRTPQEYAELDRLSFEYLNSGRDFGADMFRFVTSFVCAPKTMNNHLAFTRSWFDLNDVSIPASKQKLIKKRTPRMVALTEDIPLDIKTIREIYAHSNILTRTMILIQMSGGLRLGEVTGIRLCDINLDTIPSEITIPREISKNGVGRFTFISAEATAMIKEWLKVRDERIRISEIRSTLVPGTDKSNDDRLLPFANSSMTEMFRLALKKAGHQCPDEKTGRSKISPHSFRKFFASQTKTAMPAEMVEILMGHIGYLGGAYGRYPKDQLREAYLAAEYSISLNTPEEILKIRNEMRYKDEKFEAMASEYTRMTQEMKQINNQIKDFHKLYQYIQKVEEDIPHIDISHETRNPKK